MRCGNCGRENANESMFCQECGKRLGNWPQGGTGHGLATPPTGIDRQAAGLPQPAAPAYYGAPPVQPAAYVPAAAPAAYDVGAPSFGGAAAQDIVRCARCGAQNPRGMRFCKDCGIRMEDAANAPPPSVAAMPQLCWRCRGLGDVGAEYCKLCGARYADGTALPVTAPPVHQGYGPPPSAPVVAAHHSAAPQAASVAYAQPSPVVQHAYASPGIAPSGPALAAPAPLEHVATLVSILKDGSDGQRFPVFSEQTDIGRTEGRLLFADDPYMSPRHARLRRRGDAFILRDLDSVNGTYARIRDPVELTDGDMLLVGQQLLRFEVLTDGELPLGPASDHGVMVFGTPEVPRAARLVQMTTEGIGRDVYYLFRDETVLGREHGDIVFTDDPFLSRRHAAITIDRSNRKYSLRDLGSSNGTSIRFRGERILGFGDQFRVGRHLFRIDRPTADDAGRGAR